MKNSNYFVLFLFSFYFQSIYGAPFQNKYGNAASKLTANSQVKVAADRTLANLGTLAPNMAADLLTTQFFKSLGTHIYFPFHQCRHVLERHILEKDDQGNETQSLNFDAKLTLGQLTQLLAQTFHNGKTIDSYKYNKSRKDSEGIPNFQTTVIRTLTIPPYQYKLVTTPPEEGHHREVFVTFYQSAMPLTPSQLQTVTIGTLKREKREVTTAWLHSLLADTFQGSGLRIPYRQSFEVGQQLIYGDPTRNIQPLEPHVTLVELAQILKSVWESPPFLQGTIFKNYRCHPVETPNSQAIRVCRIYWDDKTRREYQISVLKLPHSVNGETYLESLKTTHPTPLPSSQWNSVYLGEVFEMAPHDGASLLHQGLKRVFADDPLLLYSGASMSSFSTHLNTPNTLNVLKGVTLEHWAHTLLSVYRNQKPQQVSVAHLHHQLQNYAHSYGPLLQRSFFVGGQHFHLLTQQKPDHESLLLIAPATNPHQEITAISTTPFHLLTNTHLERLAQVFSNIFKAAKSPINDLVFPSDNLQSLIIEYVFSEKKFNTLGTRPYSPNHTPLDLVAQFQILFEKGEIFEFPKMLFGLQCPPPLLETRYLCRVGEGPQAGMTHFLVTSFDSITAQERFHKYYVHFNPPSLWSDLDTPIKSLGAVPLKQLASLFYGISHYKLDPHSLKMPYIISKKIVYRHMFQQELPELLESGAPGTQKETWPPIPKHFTINQVVDALVATWNQGFSILSGETVRGIHCPLKADRPKNATCWVHHFNNQWFLLKTAKDKIDSNYDTVLKFYSIPPPLIK